MTLSLVAHTMVLPLIAGLIVGFCAGLITGILATLRWIDRRRTQGKPMPVYSDDDFPDADHRPWHGGREHLSRFGIALAILGVVAFVAAVIAIVQSNSTAACLADFNAAFATAQRERADAADLDRQAVRQQRAVTRDTIGGITGFLTTDFGDDRTAYAKKRDELVAQLRGGDEKLAEVDRLDTAAEQQRQANPLPAQPDC